MNEELSVGNMLTYISYVIVFEIHLREVKTALNLYIWET